MPETSPTWVRKSACPTDLGGGQCIGDAEMLPHHTPQRGQYANAPQAEIPLEREVSVMRGRLTKFDACKQRIGGEPAAADVARAAIRYAMAGDLRRAGFAVIHTCTRKLGEASGHISVVVHGSPRRARRARGAASDSR